MDSETGLYYLRARYMDPATATFTSMDSYAGNIYDPASLHRYLYANANPVKYCDPSGHSPLASLATAISQLSMLQVGKIVGVMSLMSGLLNAGMTAAFSVFSNQPIDGRDIVESFIKGFAVGGIIGTLSITVAFAMHATLLQMYIAMAGASAVQSAIDGAIAAYKGDGVGAVLNAAFSILSAISFSKLYNINTEITINTSSGKSNVVEVKNGDAEIKDNVPNATEGGSESNYILYNKTHKDSLPKPKGTGPNGGRLQSHHGLQQEWCKENLSQYGYDANLAPTVTIETGKGMPHTSITNAQNARKMLV